MTPTWVVILVGLGSGLAGTWLTISHERAAELRTRMLNSADEFSTATVEALQLAHNSAGEIRKDATPIIDPATNHFTSEAQAHLDLVNDAVGGVVAKRARVHLLFGSKSEAGLAASQVVGHLRSLSTALDTRPESVRNHDTFSKYSKHFDDVLKEHEKFNDSARDALTTNWTQRLRRPPTRNAA